VGLALSSGGVKGMAHVGVFQVLEENGIEVDVVTGASMGAYVGALWAHGCSASEMLELGMEMQGRRALWQLVDPVFPPRQGFLRGYAVKRRLQRTIGDAHFCDLVHPLYVVAANLDTLERVVFSSGEVATAVHASVAVPGVCVPVRIGDQAYMDGGIVDPLPTDVLIQMGIRRILAVNTIPTPLRIRRLQQEQKQKLTPQTEQRARKVAREFGAINEHLNYFAKGNILDIFMHSIHGAQMRVAEASCKQASLVLRPKLNDTRWMDFHTTAKCIEAGREVAERHLDEIKALAQRKGATHERKLVQEPLAAIA
jgi:NTE family protein